MDKDERAHLDYLYNKNYKHLHPEVRKGVWRDGAGDDHDIENLDIEHLSNIHKKLKQERDDVKMNYRGAPESLKELDSRIFNKMVEIRSEMNDRIKDL